MHSVGSSRCSFIGQGGYRTGTTGSLQNTWAASAPQQFDPSPTASTVTGRLLSIAPQGGMSSPVNVGGAYEVPGPYQHCNGQVYSPTVNGLRSSGARGLFLLISTLAPPSRTAHTMCSHPKTNASRRHRSTPTARLSPAIFKPPW